MKLKALVMPEQKLYQVRLRKEGHYEIPKKNLQFEADETDFIEWERGVRYIKLHQQTKDKWAVWSYTTDKKEVKKLHWKPLRPSQMAYSKLDESIRKSQLKSESETSLSTVILAVTVLILGASILYGFWNTNNVKLIAEGVGIAMVQAADTVNDVECVFEITPKTLDNICGNYVSPEDSY